MYITGETVTRERGLVAQAARSSSVLLELLASIRDAREKKLAIVRPVTPGVWTIRQPQLSWQTSIQERSWALKLLNLSRLTSGSVILAKLEH